jgi:SH3 domain
MRDSETDSSSSVYVAPLHIVKGHTRTSSTASHKHSLCSSSRSRAGSARSHSQITPPPTPNGSQETLLQQSEPPPRPVFHKFLRAFYPFRPGSGEFSSTVTLSLKEGEIIMVHSIHTNGWADGTLLASDTRGWLPTNYCEAYDADHIRNLLRALLNFWDMIRGETQANIEVFYNQEFMKGIIAGVRYLLVRSILTISDIEGSTWLSSHLTSEPRLFG